MMHGTINIKLLKIICKILAFTSQIKTMFIIKPGFLVLYREMVFIYCENFINERIKSVCLCVCG